MDHRIDLFALGVILFEMLSGAMPFDGDGVEVARANLLEATPAMASRSVAGVVVDPLLEAFTHRLLEKSPADRPADAKAARELLDLIDRDPVAAGAELGVHVEAPPPRAATSPKRAATEPLRARTTTPSAVSEVIAVPTAPSLPPPFVARAESEILDHADAAPAGATGARVWRRRRRWRGLASRARLVMVLAAVLFVGFGTWLFVRTRVPRRRVPGADRGGDAADRAGAGADTRALAAAAADRSSRRRRLPRRSTPPRPSPHPSRSRPNPQRCPAPRARSRRRPRRPRPRPPTRRSPRSLACTAASARASRSSPRPRATTRCRICGRVTA